MNYKKFSNNAYNLHLISTNKFKTIMIKINFKKKVQKEDITYRNLLTKVLFQSNQNFENRKELEIATEELYNLSISCHNFISGNYIITSFNEMFLNEKYTEENMNKQSIQFILDIIFKPNIKNKEFAYFDISKRQVLDEIETLKDDTKRYSQLRLVQEMDKNNLSFNPIGYKEDLDNITNVDLYKYYESMLKSDLVDIFIIGNINPEDIQKEIQDHFFINTIKKQGPKHFLEHSKFRNRPKTVKEKLDIEQAKLCIGFKLDKLTDFEKKYVMYIYTFILGGGPNSKLFKNVREKNSLCYNISCSHQPVSNIMIINAGINKEDYRKCLSLIKKELIKMNKGLFEEEDMEAAKITYINSLKDIEDYEPSILKIFESSEYLQFDLLDERASSIQNVTKEDIINISKKIHLDTIYLLEGGEHEKKEH